MSRARQVEKDARDESRVVQKKKKIQAFPLSEFTLRTAGIFFFLSFFLSSQSNTGEMAEDAF